MVDEQAFERAARDMMRMARAFKKFRSLLKTDGGRLTETGRAVIRDGLLNGMSKSEIAEFLDVNPSAISYHTRAH